MVQRYSSTLPTMPGIRGIFSCNGRSSPKRIIQMERKWRIPKTITCDGTARKVTRLTNRAMPSNFTPRSRFEWDRLEEMPEMKINSPAKNGSAGMKNRSSAMPQSSWNKNARE